MRSIAAVVTLLRYPSLGTWHCCPPSAFLPQTLRLSHHRHHRHHRQVDNSRGVLCDTFEALVGAVYTDKGLEGARKFITRVLEACPFAELDTMRLERNFVADLKNMVRNKQSNNFRRCLRMTRSIVSKTHKNKKRTALPRTRYRVEIHDECTGEVVGVGESFTIVIAEQLAAKETVAALGSE